MKRKVRSNVAIAVHLFAPGNFQQICDSTFFYCILFTPEPVSFQLHAKEEYLFKLHCRSLLWCRMNAKACKGMCMILGNWYTIRVMDGEYPGEPFP